MGTAIGYLPRQAGYSIENYRTQERIRMCALWLIKEKRNDF